MIMRKHLIVSVVGLIMVVSLVSTALGFEISRSRTRVEVMNSAAGARLMHLNFRADFPPDPGFPPDPTRVAVAIGWQEVGGVEPEPFIIQIPAGCFVPVRDGFRVRDFRTCGVQATFGTDASGAPRLVPILAYDARFLQGVDGGHQITQEASLSSPTAGGVGGEDVTPFFLGALGGAAVQIMIGPERAEARPRVVVTVAGIEPEPGD
jgi:hypothetical protein